MNINLSNLSNADDYAVSDILTVLEKSGQESLALRMRGILLRLDKEVSLWKELHHQQVEDTEGLMADKDDEYAALADEVAGLEKQMAALEREVAAVRGLRSNTREWECD